MNQNQYKEVLEQRTQVALYGGTKNGRSLQLVLINMLCYDCKSCIITNYLLINLSVQMDFNFFQGQTGQTAVQQQQYGPAHFQSQDNAPDDQFQFAQSSKYASMDAVQPTSYPTYEVDNETLRKIQQEQAKIQEQLRQKANKEYEQKQKRKEEGKTQLQQFLQKKQRQNGERKKENKQKQRKLLQANIKLNEQAGWKKVALNVPLKQGEHKGKKDITRMRESIINKRNDEVN